MDVKFAVIYYSFDWVLSWKQEWRVFMEAHGDDPLPKAALRTADDDQGDSQHAWGQDPDIRGALEGTAADQVRAMEVSEAVTGDKFHPILFLRAPSCLGFTQYALLRMYEYIFKILDNNFF